MAVQNELVRPGIRSAAVVAQERLERIRGHLSSAATEYAAAVKDQDWAALGATFEEWRDSILDGTRFTPEVRQEVAVILIPDMSVREIASVLGTSKSTVDRDLAGVPLRDTGNPRRDAALSREQTRAERVGVTPWDLFRQWDTQYGPFTLDVAASPANTKVPSSFYTTDQDGLNQPWHGKVWANPPYAEIVRWVRKAAAEVSNGNAQRVVMLVQHKPMREWWQQAIKAGARVVELPKPIMFADYPDPAPFHSALLIFEPSGTVIPLHPGPRTFGDIAEFIGREVLAQLETLHPADGFGDCVAHDEGQNCCMDYLLAEYRKVSDKMSGPG